MFALPSFSPPHDFTAYLRHHSANHTPLGDTSAADTNQPTAQHAAAQRRQQNQDNPRSALALLKADEDAIRRRKENIARFGSTWIRPPGVAKTLQAETEERLEREEQEVIARREQMMLDMQARQEQEDARAARAAGEDTEEVDGETQERDLDEEVPEGMISDEEEEGIDDEISDHESAGVEGTDLDANMEDRDLDDDVPDADEADEADETEGGTTAEDVSFNEVSLIEGSILATDRHGSEDENIDRRERAIQERLARIQEAELTGARQEEYDLGMEGNLDDSVPEAGSYEHTDTELEDDTSEIDGGSFTAATSDLAGRGASGLQTRGLFRNARRSGGRTSGGSVRSGESLTHTEASSLLESSFVTSSPVVGRLRPGQRRVARHR